jgi:acyl carrier protein
MEEGKMLDRNELVEFIAGIAFVDASGLTDEDSLFAGGLIDSVSLLELIAFVESRCDMKIPALDISLANWDSVPSILSYIGTRLESDD